MLAQAGPSRSRLFYLDAGGVGQFRCLGYALSLRRVVLPAFELESLEYSRLSKSTFNVDQGAENALCSRDDRVLSGPR